MGGVMLGPTPVSCCFYNGRGQTSVELPPVYPRVTQVRIWAHKYVLCLNG